MADTNLLTICGTALLAVFVLLITLALVIRLITVLFPSGTRPDDAALIAALGTVVAMVYPGARVTRIEEAT